MGYINNPKTMLSLYLSGNHLTDVELVAITDNLTTNPSQTNISKLEELVRIAKGDSSLTNAFKGYLAQTALNAKIDPNIKNLFEEEIKAYNVLNEFLAISGKKPRDFWLNSQVTTRQA